MFIVSFLWAMINLMIDGNLPTADPYRCVFPRSQLFSEEK